MPKIQPETLVKMRYFLTRGMSGILKFWGNRTPPNRDNNGNYTVTSNREAIAMEQVLCGEDRINLPPGTCTELYTEERVRRMVADAVLATAKDGEIESVMESAAHNYKESPTDFNWQALEAVIWPEEKRDTK